MFYARAEGTEYFLQRGSVRLQIMEYVRDGRYRWSMSFPRKIKSYEILPSSLADRDHMLDAIAVLKDAQEWLTGRRKAIAEERHRLGHPPLKAPVWVNSVLRRKGASPVPLETNRTFQEQMRERYGRR